MLTIGDFTSTGYKYWILLFNARGWLSLPGTLTHPALIFPSLLVINSLTKANFQKIHLIQSSFRTTISPTEMVDLPFWPELTWYYSLSPTFLQWVVNCLSKCFCALYWLVRVECLYWLVRVECVLTISKLTIIWSVCNSASIDEMRRGKSVTDTINIILHISNWTGIKYCFYLRDQGF